MSSGFCVRTAFVAALAAFMGSATDEASALCTISATGINFGNINVLTGLAVDSTGTITIPCTTAMSGPPAGQLWRNCVSIGVGSFGDATSRMLGSGANRLRYNLFADPGHTVIWGSWQTGYASLGQSISVAHSGSVNRTIYARILASQQTVPAGSYSSSFTANPFTLYRYNTAVACPDGNHNASGSFTVTATVMSSCSVTASALNFGSDGILSSIVDAASTVSVLCTNGTPYVVSLNGGNANASDPTQRKMSKGAEQITYGIYRNVARSQPWGSNSAVNTAGGTGSGLQQNIPAYGRVPAQATPSPGVYTDTIVVTVSY